MKYRLAYRLVETNLTGKFAIAEDGNAGYKTNLVWRPVKK
jgi:hypothetical protein